MGVNLSPAFLCSRPKAAMRGWRCGRNVSVLFGQFHLELNGIQLRGRHADALQERQPTWVVVDSGELGLIHDLRQTRVVVLHRFVQPRKGAISLTTERQHVGDVVG